MNTADDISAIDGRATSTDVSFVRRRSDVRFVQRDAHRLNGVGVRAKVPTLNRCCERIELAAKRTLGRTEAHEYLGAAFGVLAAVIARECQIERVRGPRAAPPQVSPPQPERKEEERKQ